MLIIVSHSLFFEAEAQLLNQLFSEGLSLFHLRKPGATGRDVEQLVAGIYPQYRSRIVLHHHHDVAGKYGIHRLHYPSQQRSQLEEEDARRTKKIVYSTSIHEMEEYNSISPIFSYAFLSPVFDSISKPGYLSKEHDLTKSNTGRRIQLIGLGGINLMNYKNVLEKGYDGIALCGAIWQAEKQVDEFLKIKMEWNTIVQ